MPKVQRVRVVVPATSGNVGSGFDCMGLALQLHNTLELEKTGRGEAEFHIEGEGADSLARDGTNLCARAVAAVFHQVGQSLPRLTYHLINRIPVSRGLGSSGTAIVAGALAANTLLDNPLSQADLLRLCAELEGHPDNVVPALVGGLTISGQRQGVIVYQKLPVPTVLKAVVAIPEFTLDTSVARSVLPQTVPLGDAVFNACNTAWLISAILTERFDLIGLGMEDRFHQPYRRALIPGLEQVLLAARQAGACGTALSGAGPTALALTCTRQDAIAQAMVEAFARHQVNSRAWVLGIDNQGAQAGILD